MIRVLFVCLGNICRSPMAEAVFNNLLRKKGIENKVESDSAGTSDYHIGELPDHRTLDIVRQYHLELNHRGRQFEADDFGQFDYIIAMDSSNLTDIRQLLPSAHTSGHISLMRDFDDHAPGSDVPDPYWSGADGFEEVYRILQRSCQNLIQHIAKDHPEITN